MMIKTIGKDWGSEKVLVNNELYCLKEMRLLAGRRCSLHKHIKKDETFVVLKGRMQLELEERKWKLSPKSPPVRILPGELHRFSNTGRFTCVFLEVSTHHDDRDVVRLEPSGRFANAE